MTKIEQLINQCRISSDSVDEFKWAVKESMKEYAELYARKCLEIAANSASTSCDMFEMRKDVINQKSITNINLPEHI